jgi:hypothetical protein
MTRLEEIRARLACDVCGSTPDAEGAIEHGRGCYVANFNGGGTTHLDEDARQLAYLLAEVERLQGEVAEARGYGASNLTPDELSASVGFERAKPDDRCECGDRRDVHEEDGRGECSVPDCSFQCTEFTLRVRS